MSASAGSPRRSLLTLLAWGLVLTLLARLGLERASSVLTANHDVGWFLHAGAVWLDGGAIGSEVIDTNPPLVIWLSAAEVALARLVECMPFTLHAWLTVLLAAGAAWLSGRALARLGAGRAQRSAAGLLVLALATVAAGYESGQREHWLAFLLLPYAAWALVPGRDGFERYLVGLSLALAVALKPHYLALVLGLELLRAFELRTWRAPFRPELVLAALAVPLYLGAIQRTAPSYWSDARDTLAVYAAYDRAVPLLSVHTLLVVLALVAAGVVARTARTRVPVAFALAAAASALAAHLQRKNFAYHHLPTDVFAGAALALALGFGLRRWTSAGRGELVLELAAGVLAVGALVAVPVRTRDAELRGVQTAMLAKLASGEGFLVFSSGVGATFPAANFAAARSLSPYSCLWLIAGNYTEAERGAVPFPYRTCEAMPTVERRALERVVAVLRERRPALLLFDVRPVKQGFGPTAFEFRRYFEAHPDFAGLLDGYRLLSRDAFFEYYERRG